MWRLEEYSSVFSVFAARSANAPTRLFLFISPVGCVYLFSLEGNAQGRKIRRADCTKHPRFDRSPPLRSGRDRGRGLVKTRRCTKEY